jgi:hypothetical protein
MKLQRFQQFINEAKHWSEEPFLYGRYAELFTDFGFESDIPDLIHAVEQKWTDLKNSYWWNRENRQWRKDHFALDVKVHAWPDSEKVRLMLGEPDMTEEAIDDEWWVWFNDERELFVEDLFSLYPWIVDISWGGKSGGWLLLAPPFDDESTRNDIEERCEEYNSEKDDIKENGDWEKVVELVNNERHARLVRLGLTADDSEITLLKATIEGFKNNLTGNIEQLSQWEADMEAIKARVSKFEKNAEEYFYTWLSNKED